MSRSVVLLALLMAVMPLDLEGRTKNGFELDGATIPIREIISGGPPRDGIPAINQPKFVKADEADFLKSDDRVLGIEIGGTAKAYPIGILNWHEVVNDRSGAQSLVVTYCPLCGTGMVFGTNAGEGALLFGVSGLLYNSDMLLFDRNTESLWSQIMGEAVTGPLKGTELPQLPATHTTWQDWRSRCPQTLVLSTDSGYARNYRQNPYRGYDRNRQLYFDVANRAPRDYHPKALVLGLEVDGVFKAYPFEELSAHGEERFPDLVNGKRLAIEWREDANSANVEDQDAGVPYPATVGFWFAWYAFHPETEVFRAD